jgi:hypothetical protein
VSLPVGRCASWLTSRSEPCDSAGSPTLADCRPWSAAQGITDAAIFINHLRVPEMLMIDASFLGTRAYLSVA